MAQSPTIGANVYTTDGELLGRVKAVSRDAFKVDAPTTLDYWLSQAVLRETGDDQVRVAFTRDKLDEYRLDGDETAEDVAFTSDRAAAHERREADAPTLRLLDERLVVTKAEEQVGTVRLLKRVVEREETFTVPVREERLLIERLSGSGQVLLNGIELVEGEPLEIVLTTERVIVQKEAVAIEEVSARVEVVEREEQVREILRREELVVEDTQGLVDRGWVRDGADDGDASTPAIQDDRAAGSH